MNKKIPFFSLEYMHRQCGKELEQAFSRTVASNWFVLGKELERFEKSYAEFNETKFCIGVNSGTDALFLALKSLGLKTGDEVIVPAHTFISTAFAVINAGLRPVLVDIDRITSNISTKEIENAITSKTKAIIPVHLYGQPCSMDEIMHFAEKYNLIVVEDNAQSQGAAFKGKKTGSFGRVNTTSFYPSKNIGAFGDGGAITTNDEDIYLRLLELRNVGSVKKYEHNSIGFNARLDELQAALLQVKLKYLEEWNEERRKIALIYANELQDVEGLVSPQELDNCKHVYHQYVVRTKKRDKLQNYLEGKGIGTLMHYPIPTHLQKACRFLGYKKGDFPITEQTSKTCLSLPIYPGITENEQAYVIKEIRSFLMNKCQSHHGIDSVD